LFYSQGLPSVMIFSPAEGILLSMPLMKYRYALENF